MNLVNQLTEKVEELQNKVNSLTSMLQEKDQKILKLSAQNSKLTSLLREKSAEIVTLTKSDQQLQELQVKEKELDTIAKELESREKELYEKQEWIAEKTNEVEEQQARIRQIVGEQLAELRAQDQKELERKSREEKLKYYEATRETEARRIGFTVCALAALAILIVQNRWFRQDCAQVMNAIKRFYVVVYTTPARLTMKNIFAHVAFTAGASVGTIGLLAYLLYRAIKAWRWELFDDISLFFLLGSLLGVLFFGGLFKGVLPAVNTVAVYLVVIVLYATVRSRMRKKRYA